jgi:hypothetical protein
MSSKILKYNGEKYRCHYNINKIKYYVNREYGYGFDPRRMYQVVMLNKKTGDLRFDMNLCALSADDVIMYFEGHFHRNYEVIDAWSILELIEDRPCLERRLKYQLSRRNEFSGKAEKYPHAYRACREAPRKTVKKLREL